MKILKNFYKYTVLSLLFCVSFSIIDLLKGTAIEFLDNFIKSVCSVSVICVCKIMSHIREFTATKE